jgi:prepilin-type N-terminal cleavage/methylation domain-containing protein
MNKRAFTLIELLVVIIIVGILASFIIISMSGATAAANDVRRKADVNQLTKAVLIYKTNNPDALLPIDADGCKIGNDCADNIIFGTASTLKDPDGSYYTYTSSDGIDFTITSKLSNDNNYSFDSSTGSYREEVGIKIDGACGTANKPYYAASNSFGVDTFCNTGTVSSVPSFPSVGGISSWSCVGSAGGVTASCSASRSLSSCVSGGGLTCIETTDGDYVVNKYVLSGSSTGNTNWTVPSEVDLVEYLVVAGGGGGGRAGGGAGGLLHGNMSVSGTISIAVGAGGSAGGGKGSNSSFSTITAIGGGYGGYNCYCSTGTGGSGGSGGGGTGCGCDQTNYGSGTSGQGNSGGQGVPGSTIDGAGGGGGAGGAGSYGSAEGLNIAGGPGVSYSITGSLVTYAAGGMGNGGSAGVADTGNGGGGVYGNVGSTGGSGVVIVRFLAP